MRRLLLILFIAAALPCRASSAERASAPAILFNEGNEHYQSGDFAAAERCYRRLLDQGVSGSAVCYNLGNACFKQKKLGEAIYYWEKAHLMAPADPDIAQNLQLANLLIVDRIPVPDDPLWVRVASQAVHLFSIAQEIRLALVLFALANVLLGFSRLARGRRIAFWTLTGSLTALALLLVLSISIAWKVYEGNHRRQGVVVEQKVDIRSGPGTANIAVVAVHEGILVQVRGESNGWYQISLANGWTGWLPAASIRVL